MARKGYWRRTKSGKRAWVRPSGGSLGGLKHAKSKGIGVSAVGRRLSPTSKANLPDPRLRNMLATLKVNARHGGQGLNEYSAHLGRWEGLPRDEKGYARVGGKRLPSTPGPGIRAASYDLEALRKRGLVSKKKVAHRVYNVGHQRAVVSLPQDLTPGVETENLYRPK